MARFLNKDAKKVGTAPGSLIFVGSKKTERVVINALQYNTSHCDHFNDVSFNDLQGIMTDDNLTWIDVYGLHETEVIGRFGELLGIHALLQEDILNTNQRPKYEEYAQHSVFIAKMLSVEEEKDVVHTEQISIIIGPNYLVSFQETQGDVFESIRQRIINQTTRIRERGSDYLAFALLDAIVDNYIVSIEHLGNKIEALEAELLENVEKGHLPRINMFKREISAIRRIVRPALEIAFQYEKSESELLRDETVPFIKDLEDHITQASEAIEIYKELLNDELALYHTAMDNRLNDTLRVLTVFSVIFIPLTFLAGIYGMNFDYIPELGYRYGYYIFWCVEIGIAALMLFYFYRKKWL
jgi:magnesium transporter